MMSVNSVSSMGRASYRLAYLCPYLTCYYSLPYVPPSSPSSSTFPLPTSNSFPTPSLLPLFPPSPFLLHFPPPPPLYSPDSPTNIASSSAQMNFPSPTNPLPPISSGAQPAAMGGGGGSLWACLHCTYINHAQCTDCEVCHLPRSQ